MAINPASSRLVVGNRTSRSLSIINTATFSVVATVPVGGSPELVAIDASDTRVYASLQGASRVDIVDGLTHRVSGSETFVDGPVLNLAVAQFTGRLAVGLQRKVFQVLAPATAVETGRTPRAAAVNPVTRRVYTADIKNNTVTVVDGAANSVIRTIAVPGTPVGVAVDSAAQRVYVAGSGNRRLGIYNGAPGADFGKHLATVTTGLTPWAVAADPITHRVWVANLHGSGVTVLNAVTNQKASVPTASEPRAVAMDSTAGRVYVAHGAGNRVTVHDIGSNALLATVFLVPGGFPEGIAVDPQGHRAYVTDEFGDRLTVIDTLTSKHLGSPLAVARGAFAAAVDSAHGRVYVSGASEDTVWSLNTSALP